MSELKKERRHEHWRKHESDMVSQIQTCSFKKHNQNMILIHNLLEHETNSRATSSYETLTEALD